MNKLCIYLGVITKLAFFFGGGGSFRYILGLFLRSMYRMGIIFRVAKISNIFWGMLVIPDIHLW